MVEPSRWVIGFVNQKGGVGKTTLAVNVAGCLAEKGYRVLLIDADPQGSSLDWAAARESSPPFPVVGQPVATIHRDIEELQRGYDLVVIDGPPEISELARSVIMASDLVVIPVQPSPYDVWATDETVKLVREATVYKENLKAAFAINRRIVNTAIGRDVSQVLNKHELPVLKTAVCQRVAFAETAANGLLVSEGTREQIAFDEIHGLAQEILEAMA